MRIKLTATIRDPYSEAEPLTREIQFLIDPKVLPGDQWTIENAMDLLVLRLDEAVGFGEIQVL